MNIRISEKYGVNPTLVKCPQCGEDNGEIALAGASGKYECGPCGINYVGTSRCPKCNQYGRRLGEFDGSRDRVTGGLCQKCIDNNEATKKMVEEGGIYFKCSVCGSAGAIKGDHDLAKFIRSEMGIPEGPCGVDFEGNKDLCPVCRGDYDKK